MVSVLRVSLDSEFLHDFRVATRRTRSALAQLKGILPRVEVEVFRPDLKWLGSMTGPCRDIDVFLLELETYRFFPGNRVASGLEALEQHLRALRREARRPLESALRSDRFKRFLDGWERYLETSTPPESRPPKAMLPALELADKRIRKAFQRVAKRGHELGDAPPNDALHRLRIDAKKLRYLLEFFRTLYPPQRIEPRIKELKRLQDVLGGVQDTAVQLQRLAEMAHALRQAGATPSTTFDAIDHMATAIQARQDELRSSFHQRFATFASQASRDEYVQLTTR